MFMNYKESELDRKNQGWFDNDQTRNSLKKITISGCNIRGVYPSTITFNYPICAIAGVNGCGKSTILALASCAFHNNSDFFPISKVGQKYPYYTYSDFFVFTREEGGLPAEVEIKSTILTNVAAAHGKNQGEDVRKKTPNGRWNRYQTRPKRKVSFLGINRILPPSENPRYKNKKNKVPQILPNFILENTLVKVIKIKVGPASGLIPKEAQHGNIIRPLKIATIVSRKYFVFLITL